MPLSTFRCFALALFSFSAAAQTVEFNRDIRPILSDKCYTCHGPSSVSRQAGLRFDIEGGAQKAIVPGHADQSKLYQRISSENKAVRMPPAYSGRDKLSDKEVDTLRRWIDQGAKWQLLWSFIPPQRPPRPHVSDSKWPRNDIDWFILSKLDSEGLHPSPEADRRTLIRRVSLDLTGLPPTPEEVESFAGDNSPDAYERLVDRLLASPRYGERMAFRWMEAARYADTNGYSNDGVREMWPWRDWVIRAFNSNLPFDQFTVDQIAGDLLPNATLDQKIATGFNRNHRTSAEGGIVPEEFRVDYAADRTETTATVWMGLTVGCARCHDHKYDPIPQRDYYRMFAYFNSVPGNGFAYNFGNDDPKIKAPNPEQQKKLAELSDKVAVTRDKWEKLQPAVTRAEQAADFKSQTNWTIDEGLVFRQSSTEIKPAALPKTTSPAGEARHFDGKSYLEATKEVADFDYNEPFTFAAWIKPDANKVAILSHADDFMEGQGHGVYLIDGKIRLHVIFRWSDLGLRLETEDPVKLHQWQHVLVTYDGGMKAAGVHIYVDGKPQKLNVLFDELIWPLKHKRPFRIGAGAGLRFEGDIADVRVYNRELTPREAAVVPLLDPVPQIAAMAANTRSQEQSDKLRYCFLETALPPEMHSVRTEMLSAKSEYDAYLRTVPTTMVMRDMNPPRDTFILKRGAYDAHGDKVEPGILSVFPPPNPAWPNNRLGLARWLVDRGNPFTARVTVNRFWQMYFGTGIVKTVQDFGSQGDPPVNQELLDWLAVQFMDSGWNVKALQKTIVMSAAYRQQSTATPELLQKDPENRLLARGPRLRLGPDIIRDQALYFAGLLVEKLGGPPVKPYQPAGLWQELAGGQGYKQDTGEGLYRRTLYTYWKRTVAPPFMINFDSPNREVCTVNQVRTNTPLQALNLMNDVAFLEASRKLAERMMHADASPDGRIDYAWRLTLGRPANTAEKQVVRDAIGRFERRYQADPKAAEEYLASGDSPRDKTLNTTELAAYSVAASMILNLDEVITNE
ncbi:MAG TPA: DUF1553 domain-containing protein [Bryobacteraceae bacterium]|jgi:hypothetical protein